LPPHVVAIQLDQVEGVDTVVAAVALNETPRRAVLGRRFLHDRQRKLASASTISGKRRVKSLPAGESKPQNALTGDNTKSVVLDFMNPRGDKRQRGGVGGKARRNEAGRESGTQCGRET
jgi:hypothetical protein